MLPFVAAIAVLPWLFGGVRTSSQLLLVGCVLATILVRIAVAPKRCGGLPLTLVPLLLAIVLGVVQQWPLGESLAGVSGRSHALWTDASPEAAANKEAFAVDVGEAAISNESTISLYPQSTRRDVIMLLIAVTIFFLASQLFSRRKWRRMLFGVVAANGALFAFFGIAQQLVWNGQIYGSVPLTQGGSPFAAFVNRNNAGGYLNLCLAAAIGFALYAFSQADQANSPPRARQGSSWLARVFQRVGNEISQLDGRKLLSLVMVVLIFAGLICTLSRGAWVAMLLSTAVVATILSANKRIAQVAGALVVVAVLGFGLVDWLGRTELVGARWESLQAEFTDPSDSRLTHWRDGLHAGSDFWIFGSGLGTYRHVYRPYSATDRVLFYHAENQYVEAFCEGGVLGLTLLLAAIGTVAVACRTLLRDKNQERRICGIVGVYALVSQAVSSLFDFGLYLPANTALFALLCGVVTGASTLCGPSSSRWRERVAEFFRRADLQVGFASFLFCALLLGAVDLNNCLAVETALGESRNVDSYDGVTIASVTSRIGQLRSALAKKPGHAEGQQRLAQLWIQRYRLRALTELQSQTPDRTKVDEMWASTTPLAVHGAVYRYANEGRTIELENLRRSEIVQTDLRNASRALLNAVRGCALLPRARLLLAEVAPIISPNASTEAWLSRLPFLAGGNTQILYECAIVQLQAERVEDAITTMRRMVALEPGRLPAALQLAALFDEPVSIVKAIAPSSPRVLVQAANSESFRENQPMRLALLDRAKSLLPGAALEPAERHQLEGAIYALLEQDDEAIESLRLAVAERPQMTAWHYELATLLQKQGDIEGAWKHARTCVRMDPRNEQYDVLLRQLNRTRLR